MSFSIIALPSGVTRISLEGTLDRFTIGRLCTELDAVVRRCPSDAELEVSRLRSIIPEGIPVLTSFVGTIARRGCRVTITRPRDQPGETLGTALVSAVLGAAPLINLG